MGRTGPVNLPDRPFLYAEAATLGLSRNQLRKAVGSGAVRRVLSSVYCDARLPDTLERRAASASLVTAGHVVVSDHAAAWLHGIDAYDPFALEVLPDLEVVSVDGHDRSRRAGLLGGKRDLRPDEITVVGGVRVTTPLRTAADLGCRRGRFAAMAVLDAFMRDHGITAEDYRRMIRRFAGRRGVTQLRELVAYADPVCESPGESWTKLAVIDAGLPAPTPQVWVTLPGVGRVRLDFAYRGLRIAVEYDGEEFHTSPEHREADRRRRQALRDAGWIVIVVRKDGFTAPVLDAWLAELGASLAHRRRDRRRSYARAPRERRTRSRR